MAKGKLKLPALWLIGLAALAGAAAGGLAVYVTGGADGNRAPAALARDETAQEASAGGDDARCAAKADAAKRIGAAATGDVAAMTRADPPRDLADLAFTGPDGDSLTLADFSGKTVLMNLWATWCAPCREEMPHLDRLQAEMGSDDFQVVAVNVDSGDAKKPRKFLDEIGVEALPLYREGSLTLFNTVKERGLALGLPVTMLIDGDGCLLANMNGPADWAGEDAREFVRAAAAPEG